MVRWQAALFGLAGLALGAAPALAATIHVGVVVSETGPAASLGIPQQKTVPLLPKTIGGDTIQYIVLDDASDPTKAVADTRKLIDADHADVIIGSSITPSSLAMVDVVAEKHVPMISMSASKAIIWPMDAKKKWVFKVPQNDGLMARAIATYMAAHGVKTVGWIGFNDAYGDDWLTQSKLAFGAKHIRITDAERYSRTDTSVTGQVLKVIATHPDAVLIAASGTPAALPQKALRQYGYKGVIYQTHGVATKDFIRVGGKAVEGTILPAGPVLVADQLPDSNPIKKVALAYTHAYEKANGPGSLSTFGAHMNDASILLQNAIPVALKTGAKPGTEAFRSALRTALENLHEVVLDHGIANMTPTNHNGFDKRAAVMVTIKDGTWKLLSD